MKRTGPNDASGVVWAIGELFKNFFRVFFIYKLMIYLHSVVIYQVRDREEGDEENGPKRRQTRRLGHR